MADRRSPLHCGFGAQARSASDQLRTKHGSRGQSFRAVYDPSNCGPKKIALGHVRGSMNLCASRSQVMEQSNCNIILRGMLGGASLLVLIAAGFAICTANDADAQTADAGGVPVVDYVTKGDTNSGGILVPAPDGNLDVPAPAADYDLPADARSVAEGDTGIGDVGDTDSVLELPQLVDPSSYAVGAPANVNPRPNDSNAALGNAEAVPADSDSVLFDPDDGNQPDDIADNAAADVPYSGAMSNAQDYQDQADNGPVEVYAAPVYVEPAPAYFARMPDPATPLALRARANDQRPIADVLRPHAGGRGHFPVGTETPLFNLRRGQGFVMQRGPMAMAGRGHRR
jgi:hypothetical protein